MKALESRFDAIERSPVPAQTNKPNLLQIPD